MKIIQKGIAGTLESSDVLVIISPEPGIGVQLSVQSKVEKQFGEAIRHLITKVIETLGVTDVTVDVKDQGALDCVITARVETAIYRASGIEKVNYEVLT